MPAGRCGIALRTAFVPVASRCAAITHEILASDYTILTRASPARIFVLRPSVAIVNFTAFEPATESAFLCRLLQTLRRRAHALVAALGVDTFRSGVTCVPPLYRQIVALVDVEALRALGAVVQGAPVAGFATAVVPTGHVEARGRPMTPVQIAGALVQVELAAVADVTASTGTPPGCHALAAILTGLIAHGFTRITVAGITVLADAVVAAGSVHARGVLITLVMTSRALVQLGAIELVDSMVTRKTLARIRADHVDASRVCVTMMTVRSTLLLALVHIVTVKTIPLETDIAMAGVGRLEIQAGRVSVTLVALRAVIHPWTKFAALFCHADLLARWTRQWWALDISVEPLAGEATVGAVALDALFRVDPLAVIVYYAMQETLFETNRATLSFRNDRMLAGSRGAGRWPALDIAVDAGTLLAIFLPGRAVLVDGTVRPTGLLALALLHFAYPALCSG